MNYDTEQLNLKMNKDRIKRSHTFNVPSKANNGQGANMNYQGQATRSAPQFIKSPYVKANSVSPTNHQKFVPMVKRNNTSPNFNSAKPVMRSHTVARNPNNMKRYDININIKDFDVKNMDTRNPSNTYAQQQQYNQNHTNMFDHGHKTFIFYGPNKHQDLIFVGQNPVLKNYFKLRRVKYDELAENLKKGDVTGYNKNLDTKHNAVEQNNDGFVEVKLTGNLRLDNPEMFKNRSKQEVFVPEVSQQDKKVSLKKKMFGLFRSKPAEEEFKKSERVPVVQNSAVNDNQNPRIVERTPQQQPTTARPPQQSISNRPPPSSRLPPQQGMPNRPPQQHPVLNRSPPPQSIYSKPPQPSANRHIQPINTSSQQNTITYRSLRPQGFTYNPSHSESRNSLKDVDMLLDVALKSIDISDVNNDFTKPHSLTPTPTTTESLSNLLNAEKIMRSESYDGLDFLELYSPMDIKKGNQGSRMSICSTTSENSIMSANSYRNLSFTNLAKLNVLTQPNHDNRSDKMEDPVLDRLFESGFKKIKVFDKDRQKWVIYKDTNKAKQEHETNNGKIKFSHSVEVFPLPPLIPDSDSDDLESVESDIFSELSEEDLLEMKSMKEMKVFQEIKTEVNSYKSQEMLVHKDSILNTHFFI